MRAWKRWLVRSTVVLAALLFTTLFASMVVAFYYPPWRPYMPGVQQGLMISFLVDGVVLAVLAMKMMRAKEAFESAYLARLEWLERHPDISLDDLMHQKLLQQEIEGIELALRWTPIGRTECGTLQMYSNQLRSLVSPTGQSR